MCKKMPFSCRNFQKSPYRGRGKPSSDTLYFIIYPLQMAFNVQENAVFIPEFSKFSLPLKGEAPSSNTLPPLGRFAPSLCPPPPLKNPGYGSESILLSRIMIYDHTEFGAQSIPAIRRVGGGGGGGEDTKGHHFSASQNSPVLHKLNHVVSPPPPPHFEMDLRPCWDEVISAVEDIFLRIRMRASTICPKNNYNQTFRIDNFQSSEWIKV